MTDIIQEAPTTSDVESPERVETDYRKLMHDGLWKNNSATVQVLGLCPLLAVSNSVVNALALGLATMLVLIGSNTVVSVIRNFTVNEIRLPVFVMVIAALVTAIEFIMQAFTFELYLILGIFLPLITTNCIVLGRADAYASRNSVLPAMLDGLWMGLGFALVLVVLGMMRELLGSGTLFSNMDLLFGDMASSWKLTLFGENYRGFLFALLPPGAFVGLGVLIAGKNLINQRIESKEKARKVQQEKVSKRVRTTGKIS